VISSFVVNQFVILFDLVLWIFVMFGFSKPTPWVGLSKDEQSAIWQNGLVVITLKLAENKSSKRKP
jgi:hypothetical protein